MSAKSANTRATKLESKWDLEITRAFDAPRHLVFQAWVDPKHVAQWWGPSGFTNPVCEVDARAGGEIRIHMRAPNGVVYPMKGVFEEVVEPERIVFVSSALDENGNSMFDVRTTVTFAEKQRKTSVTMNAQVLHETIVAPQYLKGMEAGWTQSLERLANHLQSAKEK
jgi:uncharacterized protein YndB with AHSA1/START domain